MLAGSDDEYKNYVDSHFGVADFHASVAMRRSVAYMPPAWTFTNMIGAGAVSMLRKRGFAKKIWTNFDQQVLDSLLVQLEMSTANWSAVNAFAVIPDESRYFLLTDDGQKTTSLVPYYNGAICAFLSRKSYRENPDLEWRAKCLRSILEYGIVQQVRSAYMSANQGDCKTSCRSSSSCSMMVWCNKQLGSLFGVQTSFVDGYMEGITHLDDDDDHPSQRLMMTEQTILPPMTINEDVLESFLPRDLLLVYNALAVLLLPNDSTIVLDCSTTDDEKEELVRKMLQIEPPIVEDVSIICNNGYVTTTFKQWLAMVVASSLLFFNEEDRTAEKIDAIHHRDVRRLLGICNLHAYSASLIAKKEEYRKTKVTRRLNSIAQDAVFGTNSVDEFISALATNFSDRGKPGVDLIETLLLKEVKEEGKEDDIPSYLDKLFVFVTGRHPVSFDVCWSNGVSISNKRLGRFTKLFVERKEKEMALLGILRFAGKKKHKHQYKRSIVNRHGYGSSLASFWGLGFNSLEEMRETVNPAQWLVFLEERIRVYFSSGKCRGVGHYLRDLVIAKTATQEEQNLFVKMFLGEDENIKKNL